MRLRDSREFCLLFCFKSVKLSAFPHFPIRHVALISGEGNWIRVSCQCQCHLRDYDICLRAVKWNTSITEAFPVALIFLFYTIITGKISISRSWVISNSIRMELPRLRWVKKTMETMIHWHIGMWTTPHRKSRLWIFYYIFFRVTE